MHIQELLVERAITSKGAHGGGRAVGGAAVSEESAGDDGHGLIWSKDII